MTLMETGSDLVGVSIDGVRNEAADKLRILSRCPPMQAGMGRTSQGSVFFGNIPLPKTERPLRSNVPELNDQFPLSLSLVLRRMLLGAKADDKEDASAKVLTHVCEDLTQLSK